MLRSERRNYAPAQRGFTLVELVAVLVLVGILSATYLARNTSSNTLQMQASRDQLVSAFFMAQQKAMVQPLAIQLTTNGTSIDVRLDANANGSFSSDESIAIGGVTYPIQILPNQNLSSSTFLFDQLGQTTAGTVTLTQGVGSVDVDVSATGFAE